MNDLKIFEHETFGKVRTLTIDGEPWIVGKDVAEALGYKDTSDALKKHVDADDKLSRCFADSGQNREMYIINESGLYSLILGSKLPTAKQFKRWVTSEVLPSIRKHGMYATDELIDNPDFAIEVLKKLKEERAQRKMLETTVAGQRQQIAEMTPKVNYYDIVLQCKEAIPITVIAKDFGMTGKGLNDYLYEKGVQYKHGKVWLLYSKYTQMGYTQTKTALYGDIGNIKSQIYTCWTQKGRLFLYDLLKQDGILPLIERTEYNSIERKDK